MDPKTGYCYGCARNNEEKINWKDDKISNEWKENNIKEIMIKFYQRIKVLFAHR